jgi:hypothetical protein
LTLLCAIAVGVVTGLIVNEASDVSPWLAGHLLAIHARLAERRAGERSLILAEMRADLEEVPGKLTKLAVALYHVADAAVVRLRRDWRRRCRPAVARAARRVGSAVVTLGIGLVVGLCALLYLVLITLVGAGLSELVQAYGDSMAFAVAALPVALGVTALMVISVERESRQRL